MPLTDTVIRKAAPHDKPYKLSDEGDMYLEVMPTGAKYWRLKYRITEVAKRYGLSDVGLAKALQDDGYSAADTWVLGQIAGRCKA